MEANPGENLFQGQELSLIVSAPSLIVICRLSVVQRLSFAFSRLHLFLCFFVFCYCCARRVRVWACVIGARTFRSGLLAYGLSACFACLVVVAVRGGTGQFVPFFFLCALRPFSLFVSSDSAVHALSVSFLKGFV